MSNRVVPIALKLEQAEWQPRPEYGGEVYVAYRSRDGKRAIAAWREKGTFEFTFPFDEFFYIVRGSLTATIAGGEPNKYEAGDAVYFEVGTTVLFDISDDFMNVTFVTSDTEIEL